MNSQEMRVSAPRCTMSGRKLFVYAVMVTVIVMHLMSNEYGPFDRLLEFIVIALIATEIIRPILAERKIKKRVNQVLDFVSRGQLLQNTAPHFVNNQETITEWKSSVESWIMDTNRFLRTCSQQASIKFLDNSHPLTITDPGVSNNLLTDSQTLNRRLANLQAIIQSPHAYLL